MTEQDAHHVSRGRVIEGVYPAPVADSPLFVQPRALGTSSALDEGLNLVIAQPSLFGLLPCVVLMLRLTILLLGSMFAVTAGFDWWMRDSFGYTWLRLPAGSSSVLGCVLGVLIASEHALVHLLIGCMPRALRREPLRVRELFTPRALLVTAGLRLATYAAAGVGLVLLGVGAVLALPLVFAAFYAADERDGIFAAVSRSSETVLRHFGKVLLFEFVSFGLLLCGSLLCGVGILPAYVLVTASRAALYEQLSDVTPAQPKTR